jgi:chromosome segregation protein
MSKPSLDKFRGSKAPLVTELVAETRIDKAHPAARAAAKADQGIDLEMLSEEALTPGNYPSEREDQNALTPDPSPGRRGEHLEAQAAQLAEHLRGRQKELDHREAELNAWAAKLERDSRAARLWFEEQQAALEQAAAEPGTVVLQDEAVRRKAESLASREHQLAELDAELSRQREALAKFHEQLTAERQLLDDHARAERERLAAEETRLAADIERQRREVEQRGEHVDQSRAGLEQFRAELSRMHGETLEIRLATEELWAELSGSTPPAALTRSLGRIRSRLADHYRTANADLDQKKKELESLRDHLSEQYEKLVRQKRSFDEWAAACRDEADQQAARLQAQTEEIERREADMGEYARAAQAEKLEMQQEIRRLRSKLVARAQVELPA